MENTLFFGVPHPPRPNGSSPGRTHPVARPFDLGLVSASGLRGSSASLTRPTSFAPASVRRRASRGGNQAGWRRRGLALGMLSPKRTTASHIDRYAGMQPTILVPGWPSSRSLHKMRNSPIPPKRKMHQEPKLLFYMTSHGQKG
jgi:hypothetical protein